MTLDRVPQTEERSRKDSAPGARAIFCLVFVLSWHSSHVDAQDVELTSSNLPILIVNTNGIAIPDEPKIPGHLSAIDNGPGRRNWLVDPPNAYDGDVGIEMRGSTSLDLFDKKSYALETLHADGSNNNVSRLGLPVENDWVLHGPYSDKSLIRNALSYELYRQMGRYASRLRFCELVVNDNYLGVYVLLERVKRDNDRININTLGPTEIAGDALTGGYVVKVDKFEGAELGGWYSNYPTMTDSLRRTFYQYHYPTPSNIVAEQEAYIQSFIDAFESAVASPAFTDPIQGYAPFLDVPAAVDYILLNELSGNIDAYRLSTFLYKNRDSIDGRLVVGPPWDYNIAWGNANYYDGDRTDGFKIRYPIPAEDGFHGPFWWRRLLDDSAFVADLAGRWTELRSSVLSNTNVMVTIDSLSTLVQESRVRNFDRWPVLDRWVWPNVVVTGSFSAELDYLKSWVTDRLSWLDAHIQAIGGQTSGVPEEVDPAGSVLSPVYPNPGVTQIAFSVALPSSQRIRISVFDPLGRRVRDVFEDFLGNDQVYSFSVSVDGLASGLYFLRLDGQTVSVTQGFGVIPGR